MKIEGTYDQIVEVFVRDVKLSESAADAVLAMIMDNPEVLDSVEIKHGNDVHQRGVAGLLFGEDKYYISIKRTILPLILMTIPAAHYVFTGIDPTTIVNQVISLMPVLATSFHSGVLEDRLVLLDEDNGEKCILLEMLKNHRERITAEIIKKQVGNNCEKEYHCGYKKNGRCTCSEEKIEKILDTLKNRNILKGGSAGYQYIV